MKRVLSIWLPNLAIERWAKSSDCAPDAPVVLTVEGTHGPIIHAATRAAVQRGARAGARLADARALDPGLVALAADPDGDATMVEQLAKWSSRWSPLVEMDKDGLRLDATGVAHLFGGERLLMRDIANRFRGLGLTARLAIAPTAAAAWGLSHFGKSPFILVPANPGGHDHEGKRSDETMFMDPAFLSSDGLAQALAALPVAALRLDSDTVRTLERLGLKTIGRLTGLPRLSLARRFRGGQDVVDALDRAFGRKPEPLTAAPTDPPPRATLRLEEPATHCEAASQALERLIPPLVEELERRRVGSRRLSLTGYRVDGSLAVASVATGIASRERRHLQRLLADKAAALDPKFGFDAFALQADWTEELGAAQQSLVEEQSGEQELARLLDRLTVKLGGRAVRRPKPIESHLPERASGWIAAIAAFPAPGKRNGRQSRGPTTVNSPSMIQKSSDNPPPRDSRVRPQRLLDRPEAIDVIYATPEGVPRRFKWRRRVHDIARVDGPERIAPEWWRQPSSARLRDYYRVEDEAGRRYWIYREGLVGDGRGGVPNWFIHGLFG